VIDPRACPCLSAVKCNPDPVVLHLLSLLGTGFDCASYAEISNVLSLPNAPSPGQIIFANPCKPASFIRHARDLKVDAMTFDNTDELIKIARLHPAAKLVLRILTDDSKSLCRLGLKFGAPLDTCRALLTLARSLGLDVVGVSFHVGSGCKDPQMFDDAISRARAVFDMGREVGYRFSLLDVGGGFEKENFVEMARVLNVALERHFPAADGVRVIGEPGRFLVSTAFTLATNVVARRAAAATALRPADQTWPRASTPDTDDEVSISDRMASSIVSLDGSLEGSMHLGDAGLEEEDTPKVMCESPPTGAEPCSP
jgi:ornithine decarboxylase